MQARETTTRLEHYHVHYIRTTPERLWKALTDPQVTRLYYHDLEVESAFEPGSSIRYYARGENGERRAVLEGEVLEIEDGRRLVHTFRFVDGEDPFTRVTYELEALGEVVKLTVLHGGFDGETETYRTTREGWPPIFSKLKTWLETGEVLALPGGRDHG